MQRKRNDGSNVSGRLLELEVAMSRNIGDRYVCEKCGATLTYEKPCPCPPGTHAHSEICCGQQMKPVSKSASASKE